MQVDFDRAGFGASAAQRTGIGKVPPILQSAQVRRDDGTDRPAIDGAIGMPTDIAEDGADIQTRATADAAQ